MQHCPRTGASPQPQRFPSALADWLSNERHVIVEVRAADPIALLWHSQMKRIYFFATPADIVPVLTRLESNAPLKFVETGNFTTPNRAIYLHSSEIPNAGIATHETGSQSVSYLVSHRDTKNHVRAFVGHKGEKRWDLNNGDNDETVTLTMAGLWKNDILLPGCMSTLHQGPAAQQFMKWFLAALREERFAKEKSWWLGREALEMLRAGKRLAMTAEQSPPEFDLQKPMA